MLISFEFRQKWYYWTIEFERRKIHMKTVIALIMFLWVQPQPVGDMTPQQIYEAAQVLKGEASFALPELACSVRNRLKAGWSPERVMDAYYAPPQAVTDAEVRTVALYVRGILPCTRGRYFALGEYATWLPHNDPPVDVVEGPNGTSVRFYTRRPQWD